MSDLGARLEVASQLAKMRPYAIQRRPAGLRSNAASGIADSFGRRYRKAFNSQSPKELHDNACLFGLALLRLCVSRTGAFANCSPA